MKKTIVAIAFSAMAISLVACGSTTSEPAPTVTVTQEASTPAPVTPSYEPTEQAMSNEELYLLGLRAMNNRIINEASDSDLLEVGYTVCDILDAGYTTEEIIDYMVQEMVKDGNTSQTYAQAVGYIIGAAESTICAASF